MNIRQLEPRAVEALPSLCNLLIDAVEGGASIGFLAGLDEAEAGAYWQSVVDQIGTNLVVWVAEHDGHVVGTVQMSVCGKANGRHRAEVQKFMIHRARRGEGIARRLMDALETEAKKRKLKLLVLDTETDSPAARIYEHFGWSRGGDIPDYAVTPTGSLHPTSYYYKRI